ncbi:MAG TPA: TIGR03790 family protein, partial [Candidatus Dormibacteraeota bacterium]|nr:TIGR03790 family protein [Candidatus Dormibacteraeota bacterium]
MRWRHLTLLFALLAGSVHLWAGGSGLNVVVVVNQSSSNSVQLANYYCEKRQVPPQNVLFINWAGGNTQWAVSDFTNLLLNPLFGMISSRGLSNQIDYVLLSMDIPFQVSQGGGSSSSGFDATTAALFYGFKTDLPAAVIVSGTPSCNMPLASTNSYALLSENILRASPPTTATTNAFLATMVTANTLKEAKAYIDQALMSDNTSPTQTVLLGHSTEFFRNIRYPAFDNTIFNTQIRGDFALVHTNSPMSTNTPPAILFSNMAGYENGLFQFTIVSNAFIPGAMADSLTSYSGSIFGPNDQTTLLAFMNAGAAGSYGTVVEPCNWEQKFPSPQTFFYQARGFSMAECYYMAVTNPYQGMVFGEPLFAPFAKPASVSWTSLAPNALLAGTTNLSLQVTGADTKHPVGQVDLFLDGTFLQTITNIPPRANNIIYVTLNGSPTNFTIPAGASIKSVASNLTVRLSGAAYANATKVQAFTHGDRIELKSTDNTKLGSQLSVSV